LIKIGMPLRSKVRVYNKDTLMGIFPANIKPATQKDVNMEGVHVEKQELIIITQYSATIASMRPQQVIFEIGDGQRYQATEVLTLETSIKAKDGIRMRGYRL